MKSAGLEVFGNAGADDEFVAFIDLAFEDAGDLREGVVGDAERDLDRLHGIVGMELPDDSGVGLGANWRLSGRGVG